MAPTGTYELLHDLPTLSGLLPGRARTYRPHAESVKGSADGRLALLLMQDGQNVFDAQAACAPSWGLESALDALIADRAIPPLLVVALDHRQDARVGDYSPWSDRRAPMATRGQRYAEVLAERLIPFLRARYPLSSAPEDNVVCGSSLGGLVSLYAAWRAPHVFGKVAALSPSVMWGDDGLARAWSHRSAEPQRIYLDVGSRERFQAPRFTLDYGAAVRDFHAHLRSLGYGEQELRLVLDPLGTHGESAWRRRFPAAMRWLFAPPLPSTPRVKPGGAPVR